MAAEPSHSRRTTWVIVLWASLLSVVMLGPALGWGYVLSYDMVWVPDLAMRSDFIGTGSGLPRAVPSDAVVALVDEVIPGMLLQKLVLLGSLISAGVGAAALVRKLPLAAQLAAVTLAIWNPFVIERLVLGHWPVLLGYAVLPWLLLAGQRSRTAGRVDPWLLVLAPLGCLSASAGLVTACALLISSLTLEVSRRVRFNASILAVVIVANAPWLIAGLAHAGEATSDPAGAEVFATRAEGWLAAPLAALGLGGIWNSEVVPTTREGVLAVLALVGLLALIGVGWKPWWRQAERRERIVLIGCWAVGWGVAVLSWAATDAMGWLADQVPGGGLLRDGTRLLGLCLPLLVVVVGHAADRITRRISDVSAARAVLVGLILAPVALMPDAAWGAGGDLRAVAYPDSYGEARALLEKADPPGDLLVLPFSNYRAPAWNGHRKVVDPLARALTMNYVVDDRLIVGDTELAGEDPRARKVQTALALDNAADRTHALKLLGISVVAIDPEAPGDVPRLDGKVVYDSPEVRLVSLGTAYSFGKGGWVVESWLAWIGFLLLPFFGLGRALARRFESTR